jgi:hypothetical protein
MANASFNAVAVDREVADEGKMVRFCRSSLEESGFVGWIPLVTRLLSRRKLMALKRHHEHRIVV